MNIEITDNNAFLNMLYGTRSEDYCMTRNDVIEILNDHIKSLNTIYEHLYDTDMEGIEQYDLGDIINLVGYIKRQLIKERRVDISD